ncbi:hypothetical protein PISL3812_06086 [Talaromyces islandicus]|uniref:Uncharacterized protein n=1 Tax=Talaromyces islandicus TaxID=28573 RepID=A0A0U1M219_TALIS|nr:hypothetical protein PISL3812_06086 [Talaromyces islandicus]
MTYNNPDASYFRPPPKTFDIFADLVQDEDEDEEETLPHTRRPTHVPPQTPLFIQQGRRLPILEGRRRGPPAFNGQRLHRPRPKAPWREENHQNNGAADYDDLLPKVPTLTAQGRLPPKALRAANPPQRPRSPGGSVPSSTESRGSCDDNGVTFPSPTQYQPSYARARAASRFSEFSAFESQKDKQKAKQVQRIVESEEALRKFLEDFPEDIRLLAKLPQLEKYKQKLNGTNELLNSGESRWVYEVARSVERRRVAIESKAFEKKTKAPTGRTSKKRKRQDTSPSPSSYSTPTRPSTGGKTIPGYSVVDNDGDSDEEQDGRPCQRAQKTVPGCDGANISAFNVQEALADTSESDEESDEQSNSEDERAEERGDDNTNDTSAEAEAELELEL